jgi:hypothetical protein
MEFLITHLYPASNYFLLLEINIFSLSIDVNWGGGANAPTISFYLRLGTESLACSGLLLHGKERSLSNILIL